jgi:hypothetical protein
VKENTLIALENDELLPVSSKLKGCRNILKTKKSEETTCELSATENARRIKEDALIYVQDLKKIAPGMVLSSYFWP